MSFSRKYGTPNRRPRNQERGYALLMMMLWVALLSIALVSFIDNFKFEMQRDQEEELVHRGVQYSRAVRKYVKKVGSYPNKIEDLENTNNIRFLRKRYKDPLTGKDFKLLHLTDVQLGQGQSLAGATSAAALAGGLNAQGAQGLIAAQGIAAAQGLAAQGQQPLQNQDADADTNSPNGAQNGSAGNNSSNGSSGGFGGQQFGGGPIVGVASTSKKKTIREYNKKNHYNQWQFIYDPSMDRGGLITTPAQPPPQVSAPNVNGQPGANGASSFGGGQLGPGGLPVQQQPQQQPFQQPPPQ